MVMRIKGKYREVAGRRLFLLPLLGMMLTGCTSNECLDNKNALPTAGFYSSEEPLQALQISGLGVWGLDARGDSALTTGGTISEIYLPFRIDEDQTSFCFNYEDTTFGEIADADTVTFVYERQPFFVSAACGATYFFKMRQIVSTTHVIDSVVCPDGIITNAEGANIKIYFPQLPSSD